MFINTGIRHCPGYLRYLLILYPDTGIPRDDHSFYDIRVTPYLRDDVPRRGGGDGDVLASTAPVVWYGERPDRDTLVLRRRRFDGNIT